MGGRKSKPVESQFLLDNPLFMQKVQDGEAFAIVSTLVIKPGHTPQEIESWVRRYKQGASLGMKY
jgi:hypothetical protein